MKRLCSIAGFVLFVALAGAMSHFGHTWQTPAFWVVLGLTALIALVNYVEGIAKGME